MQNKTFEVTDLYYAVIEGVGEEGSPIYGNLEKLTDKTEEHEEEY